MMNLKNTVILVLVMSFVGCSTTQNLTNNDFTTQEGFKLTTDAPLPFDASLTQAVVKILSGNSVIGTGAFLSESGLFISNYEPVLTFLSQNPDQIALIEGFSAATSKEEIPLPGISILILVEETNVTESYQSRIPEEASNNVIAQLKNQVTQDLLNEAKVINPEYFVQITELYAGNQQILSKYLLLNDVRLVWSDNIGMSMNETSNSDYLFEAVQPATALLRAYVNSAGEQLGYADSNTPYKPEATFSIPEKRIESQSVFALGFPLNTYRNASFRELNFYKDIVNPAILSSYSPYLEIQDSISSSNSSYSIASVYSRYTIKSNILRYQAIQSEFENSQIIAEKYQHDEALKNWLLADTTLSQNIRHVFRFVDQAYDIAEQNGASFYSISYSNQLHQLDDLVNQAKTFLEQSQTLETEAEILDLKSAVLRNMSQILHSIDLTTELNYLSHALATLKSLPELEQLPGLDGVFTDSSKISYQDQALRFLERQKNASFLFNEEATKLTFESNSFYSDSLFVLMDELLFINDMNRNNHSIFLAYSQPAHQVLNSANLEFLGENNFLPDANGTLRFNKGFYDDKNSNGDLRYLVTQNDFPSNAKGSSIMTADGVLHGITIDQPENIGRNYRFSSDNTSLTSISTQYLYEVWKSIYSNHRWFDEIEIK